MLGGKDFSGQKAALPASDTDSEMSCKTILIWTQGEICTLLIGPNSFRLSGHVDL